MRVGDFDYRREGGRVERTAIEDEVVHVAPLALRAQLHRYLERHRRPVAAGVLVALLVAETLQTIRRIRRKTRYYGVRYHHPCADERIRVGHAPNGVHAVCRGGRQHAVRSHPAVGPHAAPELPARLGRIEVQPIHADKIDLLRLDRSAVAAIPGVGQGVADERNAGALSGPAVGEPLHDRRLVCVALGAGRYQGGNFAVDIRPRGHGHRVADVVELQRVLATPGAVGQLDRRVGDGMLRRMVGLKAQLIPLVHRVDDVGRRALGYRQHDAVAALFSEQLGDVVAPYVRVDAVVAAVGQYEPAVADHLVLVDLERGGLHRRAPVFVRTAHVVGDADRMAVIRACALLRLAPDPVAADDWLEHVVDEVRAGGAARGVFVAGVLPLVVALDDDAVLDHARGSHKFEARRTVARQRTALYATVGYGIPDSVRVCLAYGRRLRADGDVERIVLRILGRVAGRCRVVAVEVEEVADKRILHVESVVVAHAPALHVHGRRHGYLYPLVRLVGRPARVCQVDLVDPRLLRGERLEQREGREVRTAEVGIGEAPVPLRHAPLVRLEVVGLVGRVKLARRVVVGRVEVVLHQTIVPILELGVAARHLRRAERVGVVEGRAEDEICAVGLHKLGRDGLAGFVRGGDPVLPAPHVGVGIVGHVDRYRLLGIVGHYDALKVVQLDLRLEAERLAENRLLRARVDIGDGGVRLYEVGAPERSRVALLEADGRYRALKYADVVDGNPEWRIVPGVDARVAVNFLIRRSAGNAPYAETQHAILVAGLELDRLLPVDCAVDLDIGQLRPLFRLAALGVDVLLLCAIDRDQGGIARHRIGVGVVEPRLEFDGAYAVRLEGGRLYVGHVAGVGAPAIRLGQGLRVERVVEKSRKSAPVVRQVGPHRGLRVAPAFRAEVPAGPAVLVVWRQIPHVRIGDLDGAVAGIVPCASRLNHSVVHDQSQHHRVLAVVAPVQEERLAAANRVDIYRRDVLPLVGARGIFAGLGRIPEATFDAGGGVLIRLQTQLHVPDICVAPVEVEEPRAVHDRRTQRNRRVVGRRTGRLQPHRLLGDLVVVLDDPGGGVDVFVGPAEVVLVVGRPLAVPLRERNIVHRHVETRIVRLAADLEAHVAGRVAVDVVGEYDVLEAGDREVRDRRPVRTTVLRRLHGNRLRDVRHGREAPVVGIVLVLVGQGSTGRQHPHVVPCVALRGLDGAGVGSAIDRIGTLGASVELDSASLVAVKRILFAEPAYRRRVYAGDAVVKEGGLEEHSGAVARKHAERTLLKPCGRRVEIDDALVVAFAENRLCGGKIGRFSWIAHAGMQNRARRSSDSMLLNGYVEAAHGAYVVVRPEQTFDRGVRKLLVADIFAGHSARLGVPLEERDAQRIAIGTAARNPGLVGTLLRVVVADERKRSVAVVAELIPVHRQGAVCHEGVVLQVAREVYCTRRSVRAFGVVGEVVELVELRQPRGEGYGLKSVGVQAVAYVRQAALAPALKLDRRLAAPTLGACSVPRPLLVGPRKVFDDPAVIERVGYRYRRVAGVHIGELQC